VQSFDAGRELLKWIAIITMTIDHVGVVLYPEHSFLRIIGRLSFPLFCYLVVLGTKSTRNIRNYFIRLLFFAFFSQIPYSLASGHELFETLNIFFTLSFGVMLIYLYEERSFLILFPILASVFLNFDYSLYGMALIACMYVLNENMYIGSIFTILLNLIFLPVGYIQIFSVFALPIILLHKSGLIRSVINRNNSAWKFFYYLYYPTHLTVLYFFKLSFI